MRAGLSTIQQTLTPEAANVLNHSIAEAGRRNHSQTTPLHVASTLLASPSGFLRQACIKSHPNSSHPLQCRALELCFSVALERLPTAQGTSPGLEPPISNALMAALKRAQAHQRRGCPEQQQQPLLAVKVELEQLIISILDDPSVSRVMREASFSSPAVKATIEQSLNSAPPAVAVANPNSAPIGLGFRSPAPVSAASSRNLYLNPRLQQQQQQQQQQPTSTQLRGEDAKRVVDILLRPKKRNPVLVGDSEPEAVVKELLKMIESKELGDGLLKNIQVVPLDKAIASDEAKIPAKFQELGDVVETKIANSGGGGGVILDLGDLKWLVEQPAAAYSSGMGQPQQQQQLVPEKGRIVVAEMVKLLSRSEKTGCGGGRLWLIGTATCETYLRCQVYHPSMEADWDLQAVPIAARAPLPGLFPRLGTNGILGGSVESFSPLKNLSTTISSPVRRLSENLDPSRRTICCPECNKKCEQEIARATATELEKPNPEADSELGRSALPQWLQNAKVHDSQNKLQTMDQGIIQKQKTQEIQKKWRDACLRSHPQFHQESGGSEKFGSSVPHLIPGLCNPNPLLRQQFHPKLQVNRSLGGALKLNSGTVSSEPAEPVASPRRSPVRTELALGPIKVDENPFKERDFLGVISSEPRKKLTESPVEKLLSKSDTDSYKKLLKGLVEKVWWQHDAASALANAMTQCNLSSGKRRGHGSRGDTWLLFVGPDWVAKRKMASALSSQVCGANLITISFGSHGGGINSPVSFRGRTVVDRIAEAVRRNPFSVIFLEDIDEADVLVRGSIKRAMEMGRIADSYGREISLGNVTIILTLSWMPDNQKLPSDGICLGEEKLGSLARSGCQLRLSVCGKSGKRRASWLREEDRLTKPRKEMGLRMGFDLNEAADMEDDRTDGSHNSSDLTVDHEVDHSLDNRRSLTTSLVYKELLNMVDESIIFSPVDFGPVAHETKSSILKTFSTIIGDRVSIDVQEEVIQRILGGVWLGETSLGDWTESVLVPCFHQLRERLPAALGMTLDESLLIRLELDSNSDSPREGDWLPRSIRVAVDGQ